MRRLNVLALLIFIGALVWVFVLPRETTQSIQRTIGSWFSPFTRTGAKVQDAIVGATEEVKSPQQLLVENKQLQIELDQLRIQQQNLTSLEHENVDLRVALEFRKRYGYKLIPAEIINRKQSAWYREALIDKGLKHHVMEQTPVLAAVQVNDGGVARYEGALVGKIGRAEDSSATVVFLTDENCRVSATVKGLNNVRGILMGARSSTRSTPNLRLRFLKPEPALEPGLQVLSDGAGGVFPFGVLLGDVSDFHPGDGTAEAEVKPAVDFDVLRHVFVLQPEETLPTAATPATGKNP
jgi:rod shape-determining protein MreC